MIELSGVHVVPSVHRNTPVLQEMNCTFYENEITLLVGKAGSGKSSLLHTLCGLYPPLDGTVVIDGKPLWLQKKTNPEAIMPMSMVVQFPEQQLFLPTVREEFAYSLKPYRLPADTLSKRMEYALGVMGLPPDIGNRSPLALSGGEMRKLVLATAIATDPKWLLLDEPTSGLDAAGTAHLVQLLAKWSRDKNKGIIIATHDLDAFLPVAHRVVVINPPSIAGIFTPEELCQNPELLEEAGVGCPESLEFAWELKRRGWQAEGKVLQPERLAEELFHELAQSAEQPGKDADKEMGEREPPQEEIQRETGGKKQHFLKNADPRAKWAGYMLLSAGILLQKNVPGVLAAFLFTVMLTFWSGVQFRQLFRMIKPYAYFMFLALLFSSHQLAFGESRFPTVRFLPEQAFNTGINLWKIGTVMWLGILMTLLTSPLAMKRGLEEGLRVLRKFRFPVEALSLGTTLLFKFIPLVLNQTERFYAIVKLRGKFNAKYGKIPVRHLPHMIMPLLMSLIQEAENFTMALKIRGYREIGQRRTAYHRLRMGTTDKIIILFCAVLSAVFWYMGAVFSF